MTQNTDILEMRIDTFKLDFSDFALDSQKMKFFHFWFFHYVNNANHRFYKMLFHKQYSFSCLFSNVLNFLVKASKGQKRKLSLDFLDALFKLKIPVD
jgi:hypothetical protein